jgi:hypothetical protein
MVVRVTANPHQPKTQTDTKDRQQSKNHPALEFVAHFIVHSGVGASIRCAA